MGNNTQIKSIFIIIIFLLICSAKVFAQGKSIAHQEELTRLRSEIARYRSEIAQQEEEEDTIINLLASLEREIDVTNNLLQSLKKDENEKKNSIRRIENDLAETEEELNLLKKSFKDRLVTFYKYGRTKDLELLLAAKSLNQAKIWLHFEKLVAENDRRNINNIINKKNHIQNQRLLLSAELASKERIVNSKTEEGKNLEKSISERKQLLAKIKNDRMLLQRQLRESQEALKRIEQYIQHAEEVRHTEETSGRKNIISEFVQLKGNMTWPVHGTVVSEFGDQKHPQLGTVTSNFGIDIRASESSPVTSVARGVIAVISWQPLYGNFVMIDHGDGYYTVYSHLGIIEVTKGQEVERDEIIGAVGGKGSLAGPVLNFQVWSGQQRMNPREWLARS